MSDLWVQLRRGVLTLGVPGLWCRFRVKSWSCGRRFGQDWVVRI